MTEEDQEERLLFLIKKISIQLEMQMERCLRKSDLSGVQMYLLVYILRHHPHGTYITELCHEIGVSKTTLSILIKKLREKGYLCFQLTPGDERKKRILPTARLNACADMFMARAKEMEDAVCCGIDTGERTQLIALESKVHRHLEDMEERQRKDRRA